ncbi:hypothetical protein [Streptomyces lydicus]|uniref:hypothetical protein n=1 Tax=Streptomyces lydicus TaxID=47763 RepID=UPI0037CD0238
MSGRIAVSLWEDDGPDEDDKFGKHWITDTPGERSLHFTAHGAEYKLLYAVE